VGTGRIPSNIAEAFVGGEQPTLFGLNCRKKVLIGIAREPLNVHSLGVIRGDGKDTGNVHGKVLIEFDEDHGTLGIGRKST
jgi:hypothetical protein